MKRPAISIATLKILWTDNMQKPNLTGTWKFIPSGSVLQIDAPESAVFVVEHVEPVFRFSRTLVVHGKSDTFTLDLTTDGREVVTVQGDLHLRARCYWEDDTLVFESHLVRANEEATNVVRYRLVDRSDSLFAEEQFHSKSMSYDNIWVFERE